jgi:hypothetical protein
VEGLGAAGRFAVGEAILADVRLRHRGGGHPAEQSHRQGPGPCSGRGSPSARSGRRTGKARASTVAPPTASPPKFARARTQPSPARSANRRADCTVTVRTRPRAIQRCEIRSQDVCDVARRLGHP